MNIPQLIITIIVGLLIGGAAFLVYSNHVANKNAEKTDVVGQVVGWQKSKIPMAGVAIIQYTKKGKPMQVGSQLMPNWKQPKVGVKNLYTIYAYHTPGKKTVFQAMLKKKSKSK